MKTKISRFSDLHCCTFKKENFQSINLSDITGNKRFWTTVSPLCDKNVLVTSDEEIVKISKEYFDEIVPKLNITQNECYIRKTGNLENPVKKASFKYQYHPSVTNIKDTKSKNISSFSFRPVSKYFSCFFKISCFSNNYLKMNFDKCQLILSSNDENKKMELNGEVVNSMQMQNLLGVHINHKLKSNTHIETLRKKGGKKASCPCTSYKYLQTKHNVNEKFYNVAIRVLIWMFYSRKINNQINKMHERALRFVYNDKSSSFRELLERDCQSLFVKEIFKYY